MVAYVEEAVQVRDSGLHSQCLPLSNFLFGKVITAGLVGHNKDNILLIKLAGGVPTAYIITQLNRDLY